MGIFKVVIKSAYILKVCKDVIQSWPGISWNSDPLDLDSEVFLTYLDEFKEYRDHLASKKPQTQLDSYVLSSVDLLLSSIHSDYQNTICTINKLKYHGEITWDLLYSILVPCSILITHCAITGMPRLFRLESAVSTNVEATRCHRLSCVSMDLVDRPLTQTVGVSKVTTQILIKKFKGAMKIDSLDAYPIRFHPDSAKLKEMVKERIMVDRASFRRFNPNFKYPTAVSKTEEAPQLDSYGNLMDPEPVPVPGVRDEESTNDVKLTDEELMLTPTVVFGFSLSDKLWLEFDVEKISDAEWNKDVFSNLVLPTDRKDLLQSLVEAHHRELGFDDFIKGKGHGLVINLFGPPRLGKTFSAEATSEHVKRPLYLVGAGDLGTDANSLDMALERVFEVATTWKAIVPINEADVYLEQRSLHDLVRNAMVAVFLRHVEYYRGILFLTTNRVKAFDEAFLLRSATKSASNLLPSLQCSTNTSFSHALDGKGSRRSSVAGTFLPGRCSHLWRHSYDTIDVVPAAVLDFLLLLFRALREEATIEEVVGVVSLVWRLLFQEEVLEANVPTADQEQHFVANSVLYRLSSCEHLSSIRFLDGFNVPPSILFPLTPLEGLSFLPTWIYWPSNTGLNHASFAQRRRNTFR
ncbi:uncharacterized protein ARMOST_07583 [Armillaria ostoyae]|uniref:Uncharacterized protein n=1 Tax=Armillaria ostoyae TaxID=47428 RepID=A0A284R6A7_ARMOS|nr:uncharacterized protein ARMOST_07583 [Armillaria ostoyae]